MKNVAPLHSDTEINQKTKEWFPSSLETALSELDYLKTLAKKENHLLLFRGQPERNWLLDSTFVRSFKSKLFGSDSIRLSKRIVESIDFHLAILNLFLLKFGVLLHPSEELESAAKEHGLDSWFELMKRIQQYPNEGIDGSFLKGTNIIDWTQSSDIALYFANNERKGEGALFICDSTATGKTLQIIPVGEILEKMNRLGNSGGALGLPLLFSPGKQIRNIRSKNQQAVYFAQMDLRYELEEAWRLQEEHMPNETILIKLILPKGSEEDLKKYLFNKKITRDFVYPVEKDNLNQQEI